MSFTPDELRMIGVSGGIWLRMLRSREERIFQRIYGDYKSGKIDQSQAIAEFACVRDQINEIAAAIRQNDNQRSE